MFGPNIEETENLIKYALNIAIIAISNLRTKYVVLLMIYIIPFFQFDPKSEADDKEYKYLCDSIGSH